MSQLECTAEFPTSFRIARRLAQSPRSSIIRPLMMPVTLRYAKLLKSAVNNLSVVHQHNHWNAPIVHRIVERMERYFETIRPVLQEVPSARFLRPTQVVLNRPSGQRGQETTQVDSPSLSGRAKPAALSDWRVMAVSGAAEKNSLIASNAFAIRTATAGFTVFRHMPVERQVKAFMARQLGRTVWGWHSALHDAQPVAMVVSKGRFGVMPDAPSRPSVRMEKPLDLAPLPTLLDLTRPQMKKAVPSRTEQAVGGAGQVSARMQQAAPVATLAWREQQPIAGASRAGVPSAESDRSLTSSGVASDHYSSPPLPEVEERLVAKAREAVRVELTSQATLDRLSGDLMRRIDTRQRIERERRGI